jgi:Putative bacterial sensory transduction regulator
MSDIAQPVGLARVAEALTVNGIRYRVDENGDLAFLLRVCAEEAGHTLAGRFRCAGTAVTVLAGLGTVYAAAPATVHRLVAGWQREYTGPAAQVAELPDGIAVRGQMELFTTAGATGRQLAAFIKISIDAIGRFVLSLDARLREPGTPTAAELDRWLGRRNLRHADWR